MKDRALLVLDQVSRRALDRELAARGLPASVPVTLDYLPRTTPVGHATISTAAPPARHRIQGRTWYEHPGLVRHQVGDAVRLTRPAPTSLFAYVDQHSLAARLRAAGAGSVVAVAAKDFIPYLFGAWDCDVIVYPFDVLPGPLAVHGGAPGLEIRFVSWTAAGAVALATAWPSILGALTRMAPAGVAMHATVPPRVPSALPHVHTVEWLLPSTWGTTIASYITPWKAYVVGQADGIDDGYSDIATAVLGYLDGPRALLQSRFATDAQGHTVGPGAPAYAASVRAGVDRALALAGRGFVVGVTSDHGGRDTPHVASYDRNAGTLDGVPLPPAALHYKDGDHVVGYTAAPGAGPAYWVGGPGRLSPFTVPAAIVARSYHPAQVPSWKVAGDLHTRVDKVGARAGGGDHGLCASGGTVDPIDNEVPAWSPNATSPHRPVTLDHIASWFLGLT